jgi:hypothetical protein
MLHKHRAKHKSRKRSPLTPQGGTLATTLFATFTILNMFVLMHKIAHDSKPEGL